MNKKGNIWKILGVVGVVLLVLLAMGVGLMNALKIGWNAIAGGPGGKADAAFASNVLTHVVAADKVTASVTPAAGGTALAASDFAAGGDGVLK